MWYYSLNEVRFMRKSFFRKISYCLVAVLCTSLLTACSQSISLTDEETAMISEYAAGLLIKYVRGNNIGLAEVNDIDFSELDRVITPTPIPTPIPEEVPEQANDKPVVDGVAGESEEYAEEIVLPPLADCFGFAGMNLDFSYAELCKTYPEADELVFSMNASEGNLLLIMHFILSNPDSSSANVIAKLNDYKVRALVNGEDRRRAELTFLPNDLTSFLGELAPQQAEDVVLVFEVPENTQISSLALLLVKGGEQLRYDL